MSVKLIHITPDYAKTIEYAARTSTATECKENSEDFVRKLVNKGHLSVGRHCNASFEIICSRACSHQFVRHTHLVYTQESQRYVKFNTSLSEFDDTYVIPDSIRNNFHRIAPSFLNTIEQIECCYDAMIKVGIPKEDARYILPNACKTRLVVSGNFQAWMDFIKLRTDKAAQWEIREIAEEIFAILKEEAPAFFEPLQEEIRNQKEYKKWKKEKEVNLKGE